MIAVAGLDMAEWDVLAQAAGMPLAVFLGGSLGPVAAYNSNGLWLTDVATLCREAVELVAEGDFTALKLRLGRDRLADDLAAMDVEPAFADQPGVDDRVEERVELDVVDVAVDVVVVPARRDGKAFRVAGGGHGAAA